MIKKKKKKKIISRWLIQPFAAGVEIHTRLANDRKWTWMWTIKWVPAIYEGIIISQL